jgi:hypothetical protein
VKQLVVSEPSWDRAKILEWVVAEVHLVDERWLLFNVTHHKDVVLLFDATILLHLNHRVAGC